MLPHHPLRLKTNLTQAAQRRLRPIDFNLVATFNLNEEGSKPKHCVMIFMTRVYAAFGRWTLVVTGWAKSCRLTGKLF